jgi:hypothetical protein
MSSKRDRFASARRRELHRHASNDLVHHRWRPTRRDLSTNVVTHVETFSDRVHRHSTLGMLAPLEFENSTLSSRSPSFAASRLRDSHNQIIFNKQSRACTLARAKRCCKDPLNSVCDPLSL